MTGVLRARITTARDEADPDRPPVVLLRVYFTAEPVGGTAEPQPGEMGAVGWFDELPDDLLYEALRDFPLRASDDRPDRRATATGSDRTVTR